MAAITLKIFSNACIGLDNGFALTRRHAIICTHGGQFIDTYMRYSVSMV